jgi:hypothetical protein
VTVEVGRGEEGRGVVLHHCEFVALVGDPEDNDVVISLPGVRVEGVGKRVAEEDERLTAYLVDRLVLGAGGTVTWGMPRDSWCTSLTPARRASFLATLPG